MNFVLLPNNFSMLAVAQAMMSLVIIITMMFLFNQNNYEYSYLCIAKQESCCKNNK